MDRQYVSLVEIMIESAVVYTAFAIAGIISFGLDNLPQEIILPIVGIIQVRSISNTNFHPTIVLIIPVGHRA